MKITKSEFIRMVNDINGNPRYYLPWCLTTEQAAREIGAVKYRGKKFGPGWVFQSYELSAEIDKLNGLNDNN